MNNIILMGYRGTGKTMTAIELSSLLSKKIFSTDKEIEKKAGEKISEFVEKNGWHEFRELESKIINEIRIKNRIIDCGGGVIEKEENIKKLKPLGKIIWLSAKEETIIKRIIKDEKENKDNKKNVKRPSLTKEKDTVSEVKEMLKKREPLYKKASDFKIETDNKNPKETAEEIIRILKTEKKQDTINENSKARICIPITADCQENTLKDLKKAEKINDLSEIRIDYIKGINKNILKAIIKSKTKKVIITCRNKKDKGHFKGTEKERVSLLKEAIELRSDYIDLEYDLDKKSIKELIKLRNILSPKSKIIISYHNYKETPSLDKLNNIYKKIKSLNPDIIKIATYAGSINDNFKIFNLLKNHKKIIALCMGSRGEISRILASKFGSYLTFSSISKNKESAKGQVEFNEIKKYYNFDTINKNTKILGVIGKYAENSKSKYMHNAMFRKEKLNAIYLPLKTRKEELKEFINNIKENDFLGAAVTVPHKEEVMKYLDRIEKTAKEIGAVNTIIKKDGKLIGCNTDYYGAVQALKEKSELKNKKVLVIGAGGAARAICFGLKKESAIITITNRTKEKAQKLALEFNLKLGSFEEMKNLTEDNYIIINTTSVGMKPNENKSIIKKDYLKKGKIIMDIVYTPIKTKLIKDAKEKGCVVITGERMLIYQAIKQYKLWTNQNPDYNTMQKAILKQIHN